MVMDNHIPKWRAAEFRVAWRFSESGYVVSSPLVPVPYDWIVDTGEKLYRVQVKIGTYLPRRMKKHGWGDRPSYMVALYRTRGTKRSIKRVPYLTTEFDYLCAVCDEDVFVIPSSALHSEVNVGHLVRFVQIKPLSEATGRKDSQKAGKRWEPYRNNFSI